MKPNFKSGVLFGENLMKNQGHYEQTSLSGAGDPRSQQDSHV